MRQQSAQFKFSNSLRPFGHDDRISTVTSDALHVRLLLGRCSRALSDLALSKHAHKYHLRGYREACLNLCGTEEKYSRLNVWNAISAKGAK